MIAPRQRWLPGRARCGAVLVLVLICLAGCARSSTQPGAGDPGNRRLHQLSADPIFASLPPGATAAGPLTESPARYRTPGFQPPGWDGPSVSRTFTTSQPPASVFSYYETRAATAGWTPGNRNASGYPQTWTKTYPDGVRGDLSLLQIKRGAANEAPTYILTASSPPAT